MASLRDIQTKISAVKKTRQITKAMNMVATAKLRQVQGKTEAFRPYATKFREVLGSLSQGVDPEIHPLLAQPEVVENVGLIALSADRGLCGSFNAGLIDKTQKFINETKANGRGLKIYAVGRQVGDYLRKRNIETAQRLSGAMNVVDFDLATQVGGFALDPFLAGEVQEVYIIFSQFMGMGRQAPTALKLLPIEPEAASEASAAGAAEYLTEPSAEEILVELLPRYLNVTIYRALLETATSEHAARMTAMDNATRNCKDMIERLTLAYNKARQAAITTELMDIIGGAEALKQG
ncbi:ATP synthase F1, gamma subunit [Desulfarculus baarsii DSM 2075]|uniref:ATP synthase gamma chain n=1 Tax=Desulfarculus baarsii (strain ATCC 33931 / DSM 2075 / LMG 7858 / VKM B-1802 / 2st14) TaxID=644282 RepID=E1QGF1_DESB2|nr:ATP synthase F1 subunit gamma [Desulfarculus baarsii]ADK83663.1 ATP synthase F1, gamma subunit [Desulfarculus baarsii DSM 2075]